MKDDKEDLLSDLCKEPMPPESKGKKYTEEDLIVDVVTFDYGMKKNDPVKNIQFYSKRDVNEPFPIEKNKCVGQVSLLRPETFEQKLVRVYCKLEDDDIQETIKERFREWCKIWHSEMLKVSLLLPASFDEKLVRIYCKREDADSQETIKERFRKQAHHKWCKHGRSEISVKVSLVLPETFDEKRDRVHRILEDDDIQETIKERFREWCEKWCECCRNGGSWISVKVSLLLPETFDEKRDRVHRIREDDDIQETIKERFREWCENWSLRDAEGRRGFF
uniref:deoxynucleoside triphosphate triphosphohydrolase SAMHD1-like n=1 Tax=Myxine glutinosa TaxID=7769 RepID=UPI00358E62FA